MEEKKAVEESAMVGRIMSDMLQQHERENKRLWATVIALIVALVIMAGCMIWAVINVQTVANNALENAFENIAEIGVTEETTTTATQTVSGDSAIINNIDGEQYNDSATNQGGGN